jgi:tetratricopeptide (TPR) repeat protein
MILITIEFNKRLYIFLLKNMLFYILLFILSFAFAQPQTPDQIFKQKNYTEYLTHLSDELTGIAANKSSLETVTRVAVAMEKTNGWDGEVDKKAREMMKDAVDPLRYYDGVKLLLRQDTSGMDKLSQAPMPSSDAFMRAYIVLHDHGFELAANAVGVLSSDMPGKRMLYLASIPQAKREPVVKAFLLKVKDPLNRKMHADCALQMYLSPPDGITIEPREFLAIALKVGKGTNIVSFDTAMKLSQEDKFEEAIQMVTILAEAKPTDDLVQLRAAQMIRNTGKNDIALAFYKKALTRVPEPQRREIRLDYLEYLQFLKKDNEIIKLQNGNDALMAGDAYLVMKKYDEATVEYAKVANNPKSSIEKRLASWIGVFDSAPDKALKNGNYYPQELAKVDLKNRPALVAWICRQLWAVVSREVPPIPGSFRYSSRGNYRPLHDVKDWEKQAAVIATNLLKIDEVTCLREDNLYNAMSFRYGAAMIYGMAGEAQKASDIISKPVEYQIDPPEGGWVIFDGTPMPDFDKPRKFNKPTENDKKKMIMQVLADLSRCDKAAVMLPPLGAIIANDLVKQMPAIKDNNEIRTSIQNLSAVVKYTVSALDPVPRVLRTNMPPPPTREVDMKMFEPIDAAVRKALLIDNVAMSGQLFIKECLLESLLSASNPNLLNSLTDLASYSIQRYGEVSKNQQSAENSKSNLILYLAARKVYDMKPYIERLKAGAK